MRAVIGRVEGESGVYQGSVQRRLLAAQEWNAPELLLPLQHREAAFFAARQPIKPQRGPNLHLSVKQSRDMAVSWAAQDQARQDFGSIGFRLALHIFLAFGTG